MPETKWLHALYQQAPVAIAIYLGADHRIEFANPRMCQIWDRSPEQVLHRPLFEALSEVTSQGFEPILARVLQTGEAFSGEEMPATLRRSGRLTQGYFNILYQPLRDEANSVIGVTQTATEVTEQVQARQQLQKAREEIADLLQREKRALAEVNARQSALYTTFMQAPSLLCITRGRELVYELANPSYLEVFDLKEAIEGKRLDEVFPNPDLSIIAIHHQVMETGIAYVGVELPVFSDWKKDGDPYTRYFTVRYAPLYEAGSITGLITFGYEVTEHVRARQELERNTFQLQELIQELNQKNLELSRTNNDLDNFIYTASHDLKAPIANIEGLMNVLTGQLQKKEQLDSFTLSLTDMIGSSIARFRATIADLTEVARLQKQAGEPAEAIVLAEVVRDVLLDLQIPVRESQAQVEAELEACPTVRFSRRNLQSVVHNLLSNALKYRSPDRVPHIRLRCRVEGSFQVLEVSDNGLGMKPGFQEKIFGMFKRLHHHVEGTGIGLYIVRQMVENAGGRIGVESQLGVGTTFEVYFPVGDG